MILLNKVFKSLNKIQIKIRIYALRNLMVGGRGLGVEKNRGGGGYSTNFTKLDITIPNIYPHQTHHTKPNRTKRYQTKHNQTKLQKTKPYSTKPYLT